VLEVMERREELERSLPPVEGEADEARRRLAEIEEGSARELVEVERALAERDEERRNLLPTFDGELLDLYEELRRLKKGVAAAALHDGVCQGCHQKLSPVYLDRLKRAGGVRRCEYCRRILISE
jgi:predicted  nucleic acid-binding Zn-ribbon protein